MQRPSFMGCGGRLCVFSAEWIGADASTRLVWFPRQPSPSVSRRHLTEYLQHWHQKNMNETLIDARKAERDVFSTARYSYFKSVLSA